MLCPRGAGGEYALATLRRPASCRGLFSSEPMLRVQLPSMNRWFQIGILVGIFAIAATLFQQSQNGRYQYSTNGNQGIVVDIALVSSGSKTALTSSRALPTSQHTILLLTTKPQVMTAPKLRECLQANIQAVRTNTPKRDCVAEQHFDSAPSTPSH